MDATGAIARVNRVEDDKEYGYIIDYAGVLGELDPALKTYSALADFEARTFRASSPTIWPKSRGCPSVTTSFGTSSRKSATSSTKTLSSVTWREERREDFYERLARFARTLAIAFSTADWVNDPPTQPLSRPTRTTCVGSKSCAPPCANAIRKTSTSSSTERWQTSRPAHPRQ